MPLHKLPTPGGAHSRHHVNLRIERWNRRSMYASVLVLLLSGAAWLIARYFLRPASQFGETVHPLEPWAMKIHGAGAMVMLFFLGSLMHSHIRRAVKARRNLASGWAMIMTMAMLVMTAFGLYYLADEASRPIWSTIHWVIGLGLAGLTVAHVLIGRASR
ncbi:MAG: DUF4405 domain-containing protein [Pseudomonadota bacterium]|nr:DUF4405 domain-containing protein [Pseudomonadota bacterium]